MHIFHDWNKWQEYYRKKYFYPRDNEYLVGKIKPIKIVEKWQKRDCKKCGYTQDRKINNA